MREESPKDPIMPISVCAVAECSGHPIDRCFDCGARFCARHLTLIAMPTSGEALRERLCEACLQAHLNEPDRYGIVTRVESIAPPAMPDAPASFQA